MTNNTKKNSEFINVCEKVYKHEQLTQKDWNILYSRVAYLLYRHYKKQQSSEMITDRVLFLCEYIKQYGLYLAYRIGRGEQKEYPFYRYVSYFIYFFSNVEVYYILRNLNIKYESKDTLLKVAITSKTLEQMKTILHVWHIFRPTTDESWIDAWVKYRNYRNNYATPSLKNRNNFLEAKNQLMLCLKTLKEDYGRDKQINNSIG